MIVSRRHKKGAFKTKIIRQIKDISHESWNRVFPNVLEGYDFLRTLDESRFGQFSFYYILAYKEKQLVGAAPCFLVNYSLDTSINGPLRRVLNSFKKVAPNRLSIKTLICGIPMGQGQIGIADGNHAALDAIIRRMEQLARKTGAHIIAFKDFNQSYNTMLGPLRKKGFIKVEGLPTTEMDITFSDFEGYLKTLSQATRYDLRRKFKKVAPIKIDCSVVDELDEDMLKNAHQLYRQMVDTHEMGFEEVPMDFFRLISKNMPQRAKFFLWKIDDKLVAFLFSLMSNTFFIDYYLGLDYDVAYKYHLFFIRFRDVMNWCISRGIKKYEMGITGYEPKRRLGFNLVPLYLYIKIRYRPFHPLLKLATALLKFENFDPELRKWRKMALK